MPAIRIGLLGAGIAKSKMPRLQHYLAHLANTDLEYSLIDSQNLPAFDPVHQIKKVIAEGFHGINVTHPYKQQIYTLVNYPCIQGHELIGSYNTLLFKGKDILGANTDYSGFIKAYQKTFGDRLPGHVFICGTGGVGRAVAMGLKILGCNHMSIFDTTRSQAESLGHLLESHGVSVQVVSEKNLASAIAAADGLVNCTTLGMYQTPGSAIDLSLVNKQQWAFDAVYTPLETEFISRCRHAGLHCLTGFDLWLFQGLDAFRIFTGIEILVNEEIKAEAIRWLA
jgi:shikimate dehydrogenase